MQLFQRAFNLFMHLDTYLAQASVQFGPWIYLIIFAVIFMETGLVVLPLLPGDSLLVAAGVLAGAHTLNVWVLWITCFAAATIGDTTNYWIGRTAGHGLVESGRFVKRSYIDQTASFFDEHGGKTVTIGRYFVVVRTFVPFMAGMGRMPYRRFLMFSLIGTFSWVTLFVGAGYLFGKIPWVRENLATAVMIVLFLSLIPVAWHFIQTRRSAASAGESEPLDATAVETECEAAVSAAENRARH